MTIVLTIGSSARAHRRTVHILAPHGRTTLCGRRYVAEDATIRSSLQEARNWSFEHDASLCMNCQRKTGRLA